MLHKMIQPDGWKPARGYSNGMLTPDGHLHLGGQIGWNSQQVFEAKDFVGQLEQTLKNIVAIVREAGGDVENITRLTWYVTDKDAYMSSLREVGAAYQRVLGRHFPAMTLVIVTALVEDEAMVEIEATAMLPK